MENVKLQSGLADFPAGAHSLNHNTFSDAQNSVSERTNTSQLHSAVYQATFPCLGSFLNLIDKNHSVEVQKLLLSLLALLPLSLQRERGERDEWDGGREAEKEEENGE